MNGNTVFEFQEDNPIYEPVQELPQFPLIPLIGVVIAAANLGYQVYKDLRTKTERMSKVILDGQGNITRIEVYHKTDPVPFEIIVH